MAKARVTVKCDECGREYTVERKCYNRRDADGFEEWVANQPTHLCHECYAEQRRKAREAERAAELEAAKAQSEDLAPLTGSEKQIAWATTIRANAIKTCKAELRAPISRQRPSAHWWIDRRYNLATIADVAAEMIAEDYGVSIADARRDADRANQWAAKIMAM